MASNSKSKKEAHAEKKKALLEKKAVAGATPVSQGTEEVKELKAPSELASVLEESKAALAVAEPVPLTPKRKVGRPSKEELAARAATAAPAPEVLPPAAPKEPESTGFAPVIADGIQAVYEMRAKSTGFDGFRCPKDKAEVLAAQIDQCMAHYFPQLSEKASILVVTLASVGMHAIAQEMSYQRWRAERAAQDQSPEKKEEQIKNEMSRPGVSASEFLGRPTNSVPEIFGLTRAAQ